MSQTRPPSSPDPVVALFPEASYGAALNCVGIAQALAAAGAIPVFLCHPDFAGVFADYGFQEVALTPETSMSAAEQARYWARFISHHRPHFRLSPLDQVEAYVAPTWQAIVDTAISSERPLRQALAALRPEAIVVDNVVGFPAIECHGCPWIRVVSCAETEIPDPSIPPSLSGLKVGEEVQAAAFRARYEAAVTPVHARYNRFRREAGCQPLEDLAFIGLNAARVLMVAPADLRLPRQRPLPAHVTLLDGCVRQEAPWAPPRFAVPAEWPLIYVSFGSLAAMDFELFEQLIRAFAQMPVRVVMNVGADPRRYGRVPDRVLLGSWFPQPSVVAQANLFLHHGGNNSVGEALYFGTPSLVMPYCWDGHDNATRLSERGLGLSLPRYRWTPVALEAAIRELLDDQGRHERLRAGARRMQAAAGTNQAATAILAAIGGRRRSAPGSQGHGAALEIGTLEPGS